MTFCVLLITLYLEISNEISKKVIVFESLSVSDSNRETVYFSLIFLCVDVSISFDFSLNSELVDFVTLSLLILSGSLLFSVVDGRFSLFALSLFALTLFVFSNKLINILLII